MGDESTHPLPEGPTLAAAAAALNDAGHWAEVIDNEFRHAFTTDELRLSWRETTGLATVPVGAFYFGEEASAARMAMTTGPNTAESHRRQFTEIGGWALIDVPGGRDALREMVTPELRDLVDSVSPETAQAKSYLAATVGWGRAQFEVWATAFRIHAPDGSHAGTAVIYKPAAGMATLGAVAALGDLDHFARMLGVAKPARRPAAILFADLESSSGLARRLSTAGYFAVGRRFVNAADRCVLADGGLVGRHVGDGVGAFFLAETAGSESAAARACIAAARELRGAMAGVAERSGLEHDDAVLRFGLHWGSTAYVGWITTPGRSEVTALGDEVNEAARIEACASGGRMLASKSLIERLDAEDAEGLGIDPDRLMYTRLADLSTATEKARSDAPAIAVCEL
jgi:class 3 adenylate cyclase